MILTENVHHCLHFIVISLGIREKKKKRITSDMFCYPSQSPYVGYSLLIDLLCRVLIPNCAEYSTNRPPVTSLSFTVLPGFTLLAD